MLSPILDHDHILAKTVEHRADQMVCKAQTYRALLTGEHAEHFFCIRRQVLLGKVLHTLARRVERGDIRHLVHAVVLAQLRLSVPCQQIVVFVIPHQRHRADDVKRAVLTVVPLLVDRVLKVVEADLPVAGNGIGDLVHIIIYALVHALDAAADIDLPLQELRVVNTRKAFDLLDERQRLLVRDEFRRLHAVDQQLELRYFKRACANVIPGRARLRLHNVQPEGAQGLQIVIDALALGRDVMSGKLRDHLRHGHRVAFIRLLQQDLHQVQQL